MTFVSVASVDDVPDEGMLQVSAGGKLICLANTEGEIFAVDEICTHEHAYMSEGFIDNCAIECPRHGSLFDLRTGKVLSLPATEDLPTYTVKIEGTDVLVDVEG